MSAPVWALTLAYWLHMLATVVWIGGLAALSLFVLPAARRSLEPQPLAAFLVELQRRLDPVSWFCLAALAGTGLFQMSANPSYEGFLTVHNLWAVAILIKHLLFFGMTAVSAYMTWVVLPGLSRVVLRQALAAQDGEAGMLNNRLNRQELHLVRLNLILGVLILGLTAVARSLS
ncbi:MAG: CopD family protein [Anaerolineae bacterium]|jgi:uncharacterized membrane protein|nr:CopD family protein [Anaerolineae bacterium]